jgi:beta-phosphoglucomutase
MNWIHNYQLFLFDFDGLLVNTEKVHFLAYQRMCRLYGFELTWNFDRYCQAAHYHPEGLRDQIYQEFPSLKEKEPSWEILYAHKKQAILDLVHEGAIHMMPGATALLKALQKSHIKRCVVTHSPEDLVKGIRKQNPILDTIPVWITREDYKHPKPNPECYMIAIERLSQEGDKVIGFEDTPRGLKALMGSSAEPILICEAQYPEIASFLQAGVRHYSTLEQLLGI